MSGCLGSIISFVIFSLLLRLVAIVGLPLGLLYFWLVPPLADTIIGLVLRDGLVMSSYAYSLLFYSTAIWQTFGRDRADPSGCLTAVGYVVTVPVTLVAGAALLAPSFIVKHPAPILIAFSIAVFFLVSLEPVWSMSEAWFDHLF